MTDDIDLFRSAKLLVNKLGRDEALATAARREKEMLDRGDNLGAAAWQAIRSAIEELGDTMPNGHSIH